MLTRVVISALILAAIAVGGRAQTSSTEAPDPTASDRLLAHRQVTYEVPGNPSTAHERTPDTSQITVEGANVGAGTIVMAMTPMVALAGMFVCVLRLHDPPEVS